MSDNNVNDNQKVTEPSPTSATPSTAVSSTQPTQTPETKTIKDFQEISGVLKAKNLNTAFAEKKIIVVDDQHSFLVMMRGLLSSLGFSKIDVSNTSEHAFSLCKRNSYDIYLFDYNLGSGLNGRQLMEKLRKIKKIPPTSIVMIVTGDNTRAMVLSAIEQEPDDYLIKPFSQKQFKVRLLRVMKKKNDLQNVYKAVFAQDDKEVIKCLKEHIDNNTEHEVFCRCLLAAYLSKQKEHDEAINVLKVGLTHTNANFLQIQMGKVLYEKGEYDKSIDILEKVLNRYPLLIEALKYLTYSYVESNKKELAMQTIKRAVLLSPMSVPLLSLQIDLALKNEEYLVARDSIALMLDVNKCYPKDVENLLVSFVQCELKFVQNSSDAFHIANMGKQIKNIVSRYRKNLNPESFNSMLFDSICEARTDMIKGESTKGKRILYKALTSCEKIESVCTPIINQLFLAFHQFGEYEIAEQIQEEILNTRTDPATEAEDPNAATDTSNKIMNLVVDDFINDPIYNEKKEKYKRLNSQGITAYKAGKLEEALEFFKEALRKVPTNTNAMLNKIQVLLDICEHEIVEKGRNNRKVLTLIDEISQSIQGIDGLMLTEAQTERTKLLREVLDKIKTGKSK